MRLKNKSFIVNYLNIDYSKYLTTENKSTYYDEILYLNEIDHINDYIITGFRKTSGININDFKKTFNQNFEELFKAGLKIYQGMGYINKNNDSYYFTDEGFNVSNRILSDLMLK